MSKRLKTYWLMQLLKADDPLFFIIRTFNCLNISTSDAYCLITLYMRLCKKRMIRNENKKLFATFENRVIDAEEFVGHDKTASQFYYNKNLFEWEKDIPNIFPRRHY